MKKTLTEAANHWMNEDDNRDKYQAMEDEVREQLSGVTLKTKDGMTWKFAKDPNGGTILLRDGKEDKNVQIYMTPYWDGYPELATSLEFGKEMEHWEVPLPTDEVDMDVIVKIMTDELDKLLESFPDLDWDPITPTYGGKTKEEME